MGIWIITPLFTIIIVIMDFIFHLLSEKHEFNAERNNKNKILFLKMYSFYSTFYHLLYISTKVCIRTSIINFFKQGLPIRYNTFAFSSFIYLFIGMLFLLLNLVRNKIIQVMSVCACAHVRRRGKNLRQTQHAGILPCLIQPYYDKKMFPVFEIMPTFL